MNEATAEATMELHDGAALSAEEFLQAYEATAVVDRAELLDGIVHIYAKRNRYTGASEPMSPIRMDAHSSPHGTMLFWLKYYAMHMSDVDALGPTTVHFNSGRNVLEPDALLYRHRDLRRDRASDYFHGSPSLVVEIAHSSRSYDLGQKKNIYASEGVQEYIVVRQNDSAIDWFTLAGVEYATIVPSQGIMRSGCFPGLWLDASAFLDGDLPRLLAVLNEGLSNPGP
jgi:Uma2 family endonuclease